MTNAIDDALHCACGKYDHHVGDDWKAWESHLDKCPAEGLRRQNATYIHSYILGDAGKDLPKAIQNRIWREVWALQDGYGEAGYTPAQGWDWSGIRDSQPDTIKAIAATITRIVAEAKRARS